MGATVENRSGDGAGIVTRFAPSPTGYLHLGGARTALFNWLYARHHGGTFLLRIEDTDRARSTQPAIDAILAGLQWLGIDWDGDAVFQFARADRHAEVAHQMVANGHAYRCYMTQEEIAAQREAAQAAKQPLRIRSPWRDADPSTAPDGQPFVVRLKAPHDGATTIDDQVQGSVTVQNSELDDLILLRSDGTPTYMLAVVVDDHDMGVTHVIRGDDHLNNAFRQLPIYKANGWPEPVYAHIPLIHGTDGAKLSKRHGAVGIEAYRDELGILPEAFDNYLLRLGWGHGDDEIISREQATEWFDLDAVGKSPSRFDLKKLENLNGHYIRAADDARLAGLVAEIGGYTDVDLLTRAMPVLKARAANLNELSDGAAFLFAVRPLAMDQAASDLLTADARALLAALHAALDAVQQWDQETIEAAVRQVADSTGAKLGQVAQPLRAALTGRKTSPGIFDVLALLGKEESLGRIADQMQV
ncbi:glutamate--tRNA ligase [Sphingomonas melonis TY]|uniref:Glutamate--tRNA ligase n=1 Tax=Sphingomonas melonis TY TaxID=621456 RepID=A0A154NAR8_9SPHN|nr:MULTISPECIES: glutamate--tRNA ligase [Sphingomonas]AOW23878.1 glutamate--tRNA ligase [Sphingomonas melonis TY]ATI54899.1 glutamate--tRNA ligase [Sphingomonas melonis]KZB96722.1 glutamate--tRNA ligase [Sphingomonas melonis TY]MBI0532611.1 glutamate--tRNA ligase [Sphingomonas sp. TX0522]MBX8843360.1 glutamate--tRNA ligase [Sphingomonas melonis]